MKKNVIAIAIACVQLLQSCMFSNCKKKDLPSSEIEWVNPFGLGQKWAYTSDRGRTDTLTVLEKRNIYTPCNKLELGEYEFNQIDIRLKSRLLSKKKYGDIQFMSSIDDNHGNISHSFYFIDLSDTYEDLDQEVAKLKVCVPIQLDSIVAYNFNQSNSKSKFDGLIKSFTWSKKHGIVCYETNEGEIFKLVKIN